MFAIWGKGVQAGNRLCKVPGAGVGPRDTDLDYAEWQGQCDLELISSVRGCLEWRTLTAG